MMHDLLQAEAPGSMMLFGEHAVLHGHPALVCAVNRRIRVRLAPRQDRRLVVRSELGTYESDLDALHPDPHFRFVLAAVRAQAPDIPGGCTLDIESTFPGYIGLGTSAAVTVAILAALTAWAGSDPEPARLCEAARRVVRDVQGTGSGADVAASVYGGIVAYRIPNATDATADASPLGCAHPITVAYAGYKTPTPDVIRRVEAAGTKRPELQHALFERIGRTAAEAEARLRAGAFDAIGDLMNVAHGLMEALGVGDARLAELVYRIRALPGVSGAKISGSGLGDCVLGWGRPDPFPDGDPWIPVSMTEAGARVT